MKTKYTISLLMTLILSSCGDDQAPISGNNSENGNNPDVSPTPTILDVTKLTGTFTFSKMTCNGIRVSTSDYSETLTLNGSRGSVTSKTPECNATETFNYQPEGSQVFLSNETTSCEALTNDGCHFIFKINGLPTHYVCPQSFPFAIGYRTVTGTKTNIQISEPGKCISHYTLAP